MAVIERGDRCGEGRLWFSRHPKLLRQRRRRAAFSRTPLSLDSANRLAALRQPSWFERCSVILTVCRMNCYCGSRPALATPPLTLFQVCCNRSGMERFFPLLILPSGGTGRGVGETRWWSDERIRVAARPGGPRRAVVGCRAGGSTPGNKVFGERPFR